MLTDEDYGKAWCKLMGKEPITNTTSYGKLWLWRRSKGTKEYPDPQLCETITNRMESLTAYTKDDAYKILGIALKEIHEDVPTIPDILDYDISSNKLTKEWLNHFGVNIEI